MIFQLFQKLNRDLGLTILIVTHDLALSRKVSRVVMISDGKISTEKIRRADYENGLPDEFSFQESHEEYSVLDKARRVQLSEEMLQQAGIHSNKVKVELQGEKIVITKEEEAHFD